MENYQSNLWGDSNSWPLDYEPPPLTTRPGLPLNSSKSIIKNMP